MTEQNPITPPPELVEQWRRTAPHPSNEHEHYYYITLCAAQWGADQELEACCAWIQCRDWTWTTVQLRASRRPKPPTTSLKQQALDELDRIPTHDSEGRSVGVDVSILRRALEALPDE
jgi:hypothetical protein